MANNSMFHILAVVFGIVGSVLMVLAVAVQYGYLTSTLVGGFTPGELGALSAISIVVAAFSYYEERA